MTTGARGGAAIHVNVMTGVIGIAIAAKGSGTAIGTVRGMIVRAPKTATTAGIGRPIETEVIGTEIGADHLEGGMRMQYHGFIELIIESGAFTASQYLQSIQAPELL